MSQLIKAELIQKLEESRNKFHQVMQAIDVNKIIYADGGWRARDIMLNVAYWEHEGRTELITALQRFNDEDLSKEIVAFFGGKSVISQFINDLISHEQTHLEDIKRV